MEDGRGYVYSCRTCRVVGWVEGPRLESWTCDKCERISELEAKVEQWLDEALELLSEVNADGPPHDISGVNWFDALDDFRAKIKEAGE